MSPHIARVFDQKAALERTVRPSAAGKLARAFCLRQRKYLSVPPGDDMLYSSIKKGDQKTHDFIFKLLLRCEMKIKVTVNVEQQNVKEKKNHIPTGDPSDFPRPAYLSFFLPPLFVKTMGENVWLFV